MVTRAVPAIPSLSPVATIEEIRQHIQTIEEYLTTREPTEKGSTLQKVVLWQSLVDEGIARFVAGSGGGGFEPVPPDDGGTSDTTPPDPITGLVITPFPANFFIEFDAPIYTQGGGNAFTIIYAANYSGSGPLPVFADALEVYRVNERATIAVLVAEPGQTTHFWVRPITKAEVANGLMQGAVTGGTNGVAVTAGKWDGGQHIEDLSITNAKILNLSVGKLLAGNIAVGEYIQSTGFVPGSGGYGFKLEGNGDVELSGIVARGTIYANAGSIGGISIYSNTIESTSYNGTSAGFRLDGALGKIFAYEGEFGGALKAATGTLGALTVNGSILIGAGGNIRQGQTAFNTGTGFWLGDVGGTPKFSIGNPSGSSLNWDGTDLNIKSPKFDTFAASITGGNIVATGLAEYTSFGSRTVTVTGGKTPYTYAWILSSGLPSTVSGSTAGQMAINTGNGTATVTLIAVNEDTSNIHTITGRLICIVTDANGRNTAVAVNVSAEILPRTDADGGGGDG